VFHFTTDVTATEYLERTQNSSILIKTRIQKHVLLNKQLSKFVIKGPIAVAGMSKVWVCSRLLAGTEGSNPAVAMDVCLL